MDKSKKKTRGFGENAKCTASDMDAQEISIFFIQVTCSLVCSLTTTKTTKRQMINCKIAAD